MATVRKSPNLIKTYSFNLVIALCIFCNLYVLKDIGCCANSIILLLLIPTLYVFYKNTLKINSKKINPYFTITPAILISVFTVIGQSFEKYGSYHPILSGPEDVIKTFIQLMGYFTFIYAVVKYIFNKATNIKDQNSKSFFETNRVLNFIFYKHPFVSALIIITVAWLPYLIASYPGRFMGDTSGQLNQFFHIENREQFEWQGVDLIDLNVMITQHHSVFHTVFLGVCVQIGNSLGSDNLGMFIYTFTQFAVIVLSMAMLYWYIVRIKVSNWFKVCTIVFLAFLPIYPMVATLATKDGFFCAFMLVYSIFFVELIRKPESILSSPFRIFCFVLIITLCCLSRNNGIYSVILSLPILIIYYRKRTKFRRCLISITAGCLAIFIMYTNVLLPALKISKGSPREMLSIPFQQTARYVRDHGEDVTPHEMEAIDRVLDYNILASVYDPLISDNIKDSFKKDSSKKDLINYFGVWFEMFFKHPSTYLQATIHGTYGYVYCSSQPFYMYPLSEEHEEMKSTAYNIVRPNSCMNLSTSIDKAVEKFCKIPCMSLTFTSGTYGLILILVTFLLHYKNKKFLIALIPAYTLLLTCIASPVNGNIYSRYTWPLIFLTPLIIGMCFIKSDKTVEKGTKVLEENLQSEIKEKEQV